MRGRGDRCLVRPRVQRGAIVVAIPESPTIEQALDPRLHGGQHLRHIQGGETRGGVKIQGTGTVPREDAVQHERVDMDVQIELATPLCPRVAAGARPKKHDPMRRADRAEAGHYSTAGVSADRTMPFLCGLSGRSVDRRQYKEEGDDLSTAAPIDQITS